MRPVQIGYIRESGETQTRPIDFDIVNEYAELMLAGVKFPPIHTRQEGQYHWLIDGYQRLAAKRKIRAKEIDVSSEPGTLQDAIWDSTAANRDHGVRRNNQQKQEAVIKALRYQLSLPMGKRISARQIAEHVGVSRQMVDLWLGKIERGDPIEDNGQNSHVEEQSTQEVAALVPQDKLVTGKDGKQYPVKPTKPVDPQKRILTLLRAVLAALADQQTPAMSAIRSAIQAALDTDPATIAHPSPQNTEQAL